MSSIAKIIIDINFKIEIDWELNDEQEFVYQDDLRLNIDSVDEIVFNDNDVKHLFCKKLQCLIKKFLHRDKTFLAKFNNYVYQNVDDCERNWIIRWRW